MLFTLLNDKDGKNLVLNDKDGKNLVLSDKDGKNLDGAAVSIL